MTKEEWMERLAELEQETLELEQRLKMRFAAERSRKIAGMRINAERVRNRMSLVEEGAQFLCGEPDKPLFIQSFTPAAGSL